MYSGLWFHTFFKHKSIFADDMWLLNLFSQTSKNISIANSEKVWYQNIVFYENKRKCKPIFESYNTISSNMFLKLNCTPILNDLELVGVFKVEICECDMYKIFSENTTLIS